MDEVTKVRMLNRQTTVLWETPNGSDRTKCALEECADTPSKDFLDQFATVEADLAGKASFGKKFGDSFTLTGVTMSRNRGGRRQFVPTAKVDFGWGETGVTLPLLMEPDSEKPGTGDNVLTKVELENIEELFKLGLAYAQGEREQAELDLQGNAGDDEEGGDDDDDEGGDDDGEEGVDPFAAAGEDRPALASVS
jgi:hypothetical protein